MGMLVSLSKSLLQGIYYAQLFFITLSDFIMAIRQIFFNMLLIVIFLHTKH